jgi:hypothetical protein
MPDTAPIATAAKVDTSFADRDTAITPETPRPARESPATTTLASLDDLLGPGLWSGGDDPVRVLTLGNSSRLVLAARGNRAVRTAAYR